MSEFEDLPLQRFVAAKKSITQLFTQLSLYLSDVDDLADTIDQFLEESDCLLENTDGSVVFEHSLENAEKIKSFKSQIKSILEISTRDTMKVVFFGRTSNGKSTVINSLLNAKILPSGIGHTTGCFVSMHGTNESEPYLLITNSTEKKPVSTLNQLASALNDDTLDPSELLQLYWPVARCPILSNDVVFIDSPGVDVSPDLDLWIEKYCRDADVFVLVTNAESTLNNSEKQFFHRVNECVCRPNIFILNNRWDASASEPDDMEAVRVQHMKRGVNFLVDELRCVTKNEAHNRIFFISAREALTKRAHNGTNSLIGHEERLEEFIKFERTFQKSLSQSAIATKFKTRSARALKVVSEVGDYLESIHKFVKALEETYLRHLNTLQAKRKDLECTIGDAFRLIERQICDFEFEIFTNIEACLNRETSQISRIVSSFQGHFQDNAYLMDVYKGSLIEHVESGLEKLISQRCHNKISQMVNSIQGNIGSAVESALGDNVDESTRATITNLYNPIDMNFHFPVYVGILCQDFNADISFRFSLSPSAILRWCFTVFNPHVSQSLFPAASHSRHSHDSKTALTTTNNRPSSSPEENSTNIAVIHAVGLMTSTTSGLLLVSLGMAWKFMGPRFIAFIGGIYSTVYVYERSTWTDIAKEKSFKRQFSSYLRSRLRSSSHALSTEFSKLPSKELREKIKIGYSLINKNIQKCDQKIDLIEKRLNQCKRMETPLKLLRNRCMEFQQNLQNFAMEYALA